MVRNHQSIDLFTPSIQVYYLQCPNDPPAGVVFIIREYTQSERYSLLLVYWEKS